MSCRRFKVQLQCRMQDMSRQPMSNCHLRVSTTCLAQQSEQTAFLCESDGSRTQPTHHGGVWGFVPYHQTSQHVHHRQQTSHSIIHNKSWRSGNFHHLAWMEGHTGGSRSIHTVHPCSQNGRRLWVARKHHTNELNRSQNHCATTTFWKLSCTN